jgi:nucleosome binding factor SPN SPT16 subunit
VPCGECEKAYLGQTKNTIDTRNGQHRAMCRRKVKLSKLKTSKKDNGLAFHHMQSGHEFDFTNTQVIRTDTDYYRRLILEGIEIRFNDNLVNLQAGFIIDECWMPFLNKLYSDKFKQDGSG